MVERKPDAGHVGQVRGDVARAHLDLAVLHVLGVDEEDVVEQTELLQERRADEAVEVGAGDQAVANGRSGVCVHLTNIGSPHQVLRAASRATRCGLCEHVFVTSQGHAHARFRRALLTKNVMLISAAAADLQHVELDDALRVLLVLAEKGDARYERAAARFAARVTHERRLELAEARYVLALAEALPRSPDSIAELLRPFCASLPPPASAQPRCRGRATPAPIRIASSSHVARGDHLRSPCGSCRTQRRNRCDLRRAGRPRVTMPSGRRAG